MRSGRNLVVVPEIRGDFVVAGGGDDGRCMGWSILNP